MSTILVLHLLVVSVIVALTKNKIQVKYIVLSILPFRLSRLHCTEERKKRKKGKIALNFYNLSKGGKKKNYDAAQRTTRVSKQNSFLET